MASILNLAGQDSSLMKIGEGENLSDVLERVSSSHDILFAFPSEIGHDITFDETEILYISNEDLVKQIVERHNLDYFNLDDNKFLIRGRFDPNVTSTQNIQAKIVDFDSGEALAFASIYLPDFSKGVFSDESGLFSMDVAKAYSGNLVISYLGYEKVEAPIDNFKSGAEIKMKLSLQPIADVLIHYTVPPVMLSKDGLHLDLKKQFLQNSSSGIYGNDILRNIQMMSGVSAHEDDQANLRIRGSNADGSRIILDEIPLYNVTHYYGVFSSINSAYVDNARLYKNAQPIEYEGLGGGVLLLNSGEIPTQYNNAIDLNLLTASVAVNKTISKGLNFKLSGRSSYRNVNDSRLLDLDTRTDDRFTGLASKNAFISNEPRFKFYDISMGLAYVNDKSRFSINAFKSDDRMVNEYEFNLELPQNDINKNLYSNDESWSNKGLSLSYDHAIGKNLKLKSAAYYSNYNYNSVLNSELRKVMGLNFISNSNSNEIKDKGAKLYLEHKSDLQNFSIGAHFKSYELDHVLVAEGDMNLIKYKRDLDYVSLFGMYGKTYGPFSFSIGSRLPFSKIGDQTRVLFSPQLTSKYDLGFDQFLKFSFNQTNQILREFEYETRLGQTLNFFLLSKDKIVPVLKTQSYMLGYGFVKSGIGIDLEFYYKNIDGAMQLRNSLAGFDQNGGSAPIGQYGFYRGRQKVIGLDLTVSVKNGNYSSWLAYTLSKSQEKYPQIFQGEYYASQDDRRHQLKWINQLELGKFSLNGNVIFASGKPYIALEKVENRDDRNNLKKADVLENLPAYFRIDIGTDYNFKINGNASSIGMSIFNLTNRKNVKYIQYAYRVQTEILGVPKNIVLGTEGELLDRTLNLNFRLSF